MDAGAALSSLLSGTTGLRIDDDRRPLFADALSRRMRATGARSAEAYLARAETAPEEIEELGALLTVSETFFLRHVEQFDALSAALERKAREGARCLRLLSAGCSSGEEAYSLAMIAREAAGGSVNVAVLGFDLNPRTLETARSGTYGEWSLRGTRPDDVARHFKQTGARYEVRPELRQAVTFERRNLVRPDPAFYCADRFDAIFCRNVIMYLTPEAAQKAVSHLAAALGPGGLLFLGHAETLRGLSPDFHLRHSHGAFYYERRPISDHPVIEPPPPAAAPLDASWGDSIARSSDRIALLCGGVEARGAPKRAEASGFSLAPAMRLLEQERYAEALRVVEEAPGVLKDDPDVLLLDAVLRISSGDGDGAERVAKRLLGLDELCAGAHYVLALCRERAGDPEEALEHDRTAAYLEAEFAMPHIHMGLLLRRMGDIPAARRALGLAASLIAREDSARILLFGGGFGREALERICQAELEACK